MRLIVLFLFPFLRVHSSVIHPFYVAVKYYSIEIILDNLACSVSGLSF